MNLRDVGKKTLDTYNLICIGGPTQNQTASETMQGFLQSLETENLSDKLGFAFDTRWDSVMSGSAAKFIEAKLGKLRMKIIWERASAIIIDPEPEDKRRESESKDEWKERRHSRERLRDGEERRFEELGKQIGVLAANQGSPH